MSQPKISLSANDGQLPYRDGVGVVIFNNEGRVFAGRRILRKKTNEREASLWQYPQGGIDPDEEPLAAAYREVQEETGIRSLRLLGEIEEWLCYQLPNNLLGKALYGKYCGQRQKWFAFLFLGQESEINLKPVNHQHVQEFDKWEFRDLQQMARNVVDFKRGIYERLAMDFRKFAKKWPY